MEHRWGRRCELYQTVLVRTARGESVRACVRDMSLSGVYLESSARVPLMQPIDVEMRIEAQGHAQACAVRGWVVRRDALGIAIEWYEFAPEPICALLSHDDARTLGAESAMTRVWSS